jgi:GT2 family glycosyltransferase
MSIVVITRDRREVVLRTLERLAALGRPIVLVDNGSRDGTPAAVWARHPAVQVVAAGRNLGAAARTLGVRVAGTRYAAFCDDDSWWEADALDRAEALLDRHPAVALLAARVLVGREGRLDPTCEHMAASPLRAPAGRALPGPPVLGFLACAAVVRSEPFLAAGGFHPRLGIGGEEELLAVDLARAGSWLVYAPDVIARHTPPPRADHSARRHYEVHNALWTAWLRQRPVGALRRTAAILAAAGQPAAWQGLDSALRGAAWIARERRPVPRDLEKQLQLL